MINMEKELEILINRYSKDNECNTPDFILAEYLMNCLNVYKIAINKNIKWRGDWNILIDINNKYAMSAI